MGASTAFIVRNLGKAIAPAVIVLGAVMVISAQHTTPVAEGKWGGTGISMNVTAAGATIEFDCADASITEQLRAKTDGSFTAEGTFMRSGPGPVRANDQGRAVIFKGKVEGKKMTFRITDSKSGDSLGDYSVTQGQQVRLHRCL